MNASITRRELIKKLSIGLAGAAFIPNFVFANTATKFMLNTRPFKVNIPEGAIQELKKRLKKTRWPDQIPGIGWQQGTNLAYLKELCNYWETGYSWRKQEEAINAYPNYLTEIDGYQIHFIHIKGKGKKSVPLIMTHGWPGSFLEMMRVIPLLTQDKDFSFDLVVPSIIGFGFSGKPVRQGCNYKVIAELWYKLMLGLGYDRFGAQGGDIGSNVSSWLALRHPDHVAGLHLNFIPSTYKAYQDPGKPLLPEIVTYEKKFKEWADTEGAYQKVQSTKPQNLAYGLNDSPAGLAGWMVEKLYSWSDNQGNVESALSKDIMLGDISLYWLTQTMPSAMHIYAENAKVPLQFTKDDYIKVPVAFAKFAKELPTPPRFYVEKGYNIQRWTEFPEGGHFAALEQPELLSRDIKQFFMKIWT